MAAQSLRRSRGPDHQTSENQATQESARLAPPRSGGPAEHELAPASDRMTHHRSRETAEHELARSSDRMTHRRSRRPKHELPVPEPVLDPVAAARVAGLRYVSDDRPGIRRKRVGKHFSYMGLDGRPIRDRQELERIKSIGIPPAWTDVWICPDPNGHIQAVGRDAKGRKQYRYHVRWREVRDSNKYDKMIIFAQKLPAIRERIEQDLAKPGLPREKVLATVVSLLEATLIRVGNEEYARQNDSYGLTTLRDHHVDVAGSKMQFHFRGKSGKDHVIDLHDRRLAKIVKRCQDIPGQELFQYIDEQGERRTIDSADVNEYIHEIAGPEFSAKDFRTWYGTVLAAMALRDSGLFETKTQARKNVVQAIETVSVRLGNTRTICRKCYVHPLVLETYLEGALIAALEQEVEALSEELSRLQPEEAAVLVFLQRRLSVTASQVTERAA